MQLLKFAWRALWGVFMLAVVGGVGIAGWYWVENTNTERRSAVARNWEEAKFESWNPPVKVTVKTRCSGGKLQYLVRLSRLQDEHFDDWPKVKDISLRLKDADGFSIGEDIPLPMEHWSRTAEFKRWDADGSHWLDCSEYLRADSWEFSWRWL